MPQFELVSINEAIMRGSRTRGDRNLQEYMGYINSVGSDQAGRLTANEGETAMAVRRRLNSAMKASGKSLKVARSGNEIYFWHEAPKRRGRPPRSRV